MLLSRATWRTASNCFSSLRHISVNKGTLLSSDILNQSEVPESDILYNKLKSEASATDILQLVRQNHRKMNDKHSIQAMRALFSLQKDGKSNLSNQSLLKHPDFERILSNIKRYSGVIELNDTIQALKILAYLNAPPNSTIVQVLLQIIRKNVNSLTIPHILFLEFLLSKFQGTPLADALQIALPLVFEINIDKKMNDSSAEHMAECLFYANRHRIPVEKIKGAILEKLERYPGEFTGDTATSLILSICNLPRDSSYENLIKKATTDLMVNLDNRYLHKVELVLGRLAHRYTHNYPFYYQEVLFDTCANYIIDNDIGYKKALAVLRNMARMHHFHKKLLDYASTCIYKNPSTEKDPADIYSLAVALILTDYKPVHWEHLKEWIKSARNMAAENRKEILWIRFAAALCLLDIYKIDVLTRALNKTYLEHIFEKGFRSDFEHYFAIWQCITTYKPDLVELLPTELDPKELWQKLDQPETFPLEGALQNGLGGEQFVLTNLYSKLGVPIAHAIIFSNGSPVPFETKVDCVEDIKLENDSQQLLLIWTGSHYHYTINTNTIRRAPSSTISILEETLKCSVIPVNLENWEELNDFEKIPYLMQKIKEKLGLAENVLESTI